MQNPKQLITEKLQYWQEKNSTKVPFDVSLSQNLSFGDLTTNIALQASKSIGKNPHVIAEELKLEIENWKLEIIDRVEVAGPGFINFYLNQTYLLKLLLEVVQSGKSYGKSDNKIAQKIIVEFGDPNPFKEIHIGHLRNFCIGESFSKLLETQGAYVTRANYQGDVGLHVAKCLWGILRIEDGELRVENSENEEEKIKILAEGYVLGAKKYEEDENAKNEIQSLNKKIYKMFDEEGENEDLQKLWKEGREISLESFSKLYERIGVHYDKFYFESMTAKKGKEIVLSHIDDGIFERSDGAVVFKGEKEGLHTRVFLTSQNYATYEGKDLALAIAKSEDGEFDKSVILTGNEQAEYFQVMLASLKKISPEVASKTHHFTFGHVRLKDGKMSSRLGDVIAANWLLNEAVKKVHEAFPEMDGPTAEVIGAGAVKYSMLKFAIPSDIHFSFDESISLEGNSGPYLQYTYVRTRSVLEKANYESGIMNDEIGGSLNLEKEEDELLRFLTQFPYIVEQAAQEFAPNLLCNYLFELSQKFNLFYQKQKIIGSEQEEFRLQLTKSVGQILQNGLGILGISTVEKM